MSNPHCPIADKVMLSAALFLVLDQIRARGDAAIKAGAVKPDVYMFAFIRSLIDAEERAYCASKFATEEEKRNFAVRCGIQN